MLENFLISLAASAAWAVSEKSLTAAAGWVRQRRPDIERRAQDAAAKGDASAAESILQDAVGEILAAADHGRIDIDGGVISALRSIRFDHQHGTITLGNTTVSSTVLVTGGSVGASGTTTIRENSSLRAAGSSIEVGKGASIVISGGASIKQT